MNAKLGGVNNIISEDGPSNIIGKKSTIIMGADVTHPTEKMSYSIAACVASFDQDQTKYAATVRLQKRSNEEIIQDLPDMVYELLKTYVKRSDPGVRVQDVLPENLIFYRDGVSDGK